MKATLIKDFDFEAAHRLPGMPDGHKCRRVHGHSFAVSVSVTREVDAKTGISCNHADISAAVKPLIDQLDHQDLNEVTGIENPSVELLAQWFWQKLEPQLPGLSEILIGETPRARCIYRGD
jgi:6-pyruvoyltetrahydropterin/6-carboxytetrahydropterin synthase